MPQSPVDGGGSQIIHEESVIVSTRRSMKRYEMTPQAAVQQGTTHT